MSNILLHLYNLEVLTCVAQDCLYLTVSTRTFCEKYVMFSLTNKTLINQSAIRPFWAPGEPPVYDN